MTTSEVLAPVMSRHVDDVLARALAEQRLVGAVVLVSVDGKVLHGHACGFADREAAQPMADDTIFRLASVSKPIIAAAVLRLVAAGRLGLEDELTRWLPEFQPRLPDGRPAVITLRQLLSHTAGLGYRFFEPDAHGPLAQAGVSDGMDACGLSLAENLRRLAQVPLAYVPGTAWRYSLAFDVLGAVIARAQGTSLPAAVREWVTEPLGMADTGFVARDPQRVATPYVSDVPVPHRLGEGERVPVIDGTVGIPYSPSRIFDDTAFASGGAGMAGTVGDVWRLLEALRRPDSGFLPLPLIEAMGADQTGGLALPDMPGVGYGLGFSVLRDPAAAASPESVGTWRWGGAYGHSWFVDPRQRLSVVAFTNTLYEGMSGQVVTDLRDAVYRALGEAA